MGENVNERSNINREMHENASLKIKSLKSVINLKVIYNLGLPK